MTGEGPAVAGRLSVSLRIGATGHRWLDPTDQVLVDTVRTALDGLRSACTVSSTPTTDVGLTVISSLAEGADRIIAEVALSMGAVLEVVLPLAVEDFVTDFADDASRLRFKQLLAQAESVTTVPGNPARPDAYADSGEMVVQRCDALLALWDGRPSRGKGGTAEVVDTAGGAAKPVAWVAVAPPGVEAAPLIKQMPREIVVLGPKAFASLDRYNTQSVPIDVKAAPPEGFPQEGVISDFVLPYFLRADRVATRRQVWFRRLSIAIYAFSVVAISAPAANLAYWHGEKEFLTWIELAFLLLIIAVLLLGRRTLLLERWLAARFLAERLRSLAFLAELSADDSPQLTPPDTTHVTASDEWRDRAMSELSIRTPHPDVDMRVLFRTVRARLSEEWLRPQARYHAKVSATAWRRHRQFKWIAIGLFTVSVLAAISHLVGPSKPEHEYPAFVALVAPIIGAAFSGYSAQRDYTRVALRSEGMIRTLNSAITDVASTSTLDDLRGVAQRTDIVMQGESVDWYFAARLREPEVP
ncbi:MAG TPA: hypothetical protein VGH43_14035 [Jatrophihabitans sp.]|jgi:hypothetical protein